MIDLTDFGNVASDFGTQFEYLADGQGFTFTLDGADITETLSRALFFFDTAEEAFNYVVECDNTMSAACEDLCCCLVCMGVASKG